MSYSTAGRLVNQKTIKWLWLIAHKDISFKYTNVFGYIFGARERHAFYQDNSDVAMIICQKDILLCNAETMSLFQKKCVQEDQHNFLQMSKMIMCRPFILINEATMGLM
jgi:hypothetical protein